ncbi:MULTISPECIES: twin-arginine translocase TatA/TatE family subunit [Paenibacillus]|uniref:Sec-independent protein translocase protein TatA n=2 Tax=Paenibacillus TaxID=44249 RepID=A0A1V4HKH3_9BACL|nr:MULTISPECIES: twin-arginine translocase TatA/TatE family subunit [Paenibacillus]MEC0229987.1 twin-arginine translocase TatA/TatE family subunit [Paenibacillus alba]NQX66195.1 twin-arginine translocase TatA/TatE family subunit [Paenibacillus alba]OPH57752.1 preprotein translocase subunit TatA [Paenibacillus ferrarius]
MFNNIGVSGLILILAIALIVFGPSKLPQLGRAFGDTLREFRNSTRNIMDESERDHLIESEDKKRL